MAAVVVAAAAAHLIYLTLRLERVWKKTRVTKVQSSSMFIRHVVHIIESVEPETVHPPPFSFFKLETGSLLDRKVQRGRLRNGLGCSG